MAQAAEIFDLTNLRMRSRNYSECWNDRYALCWVKTRARTYLSTAQENRPLRIEVADEGVLRAPDYQE
jgi:hypothetical protein